MQRILQHTLQHSRDAVCLGNAAKTAPKDAAQRPEIRPLSHARSPHHTQPSVSVRYVYISVHTTNTHVYLQNAFIYQNDHFCIHEQDSFLKTPFVSTNIIIFHPSILNNPLQNAFIVLHRTLVSWMCTAFCIWSVLSSISYLNRSSSSR